MRHIYLYLLIIAICTPTLASNTDLDPIAIREAVMTEGMVISIQTKHGELIIHAGKSAGRSYTWDGETVKVSLIPRQKRWHGTLGLLSPHPMRPPHKNVGHMIVEECQLHFKSLDYTIKILKKHGDEIIYNDAGLFIRFLKVPVGEGFAIDISVFQILINGKKPSQLPGSQNHKIKVIQTLNQ